MWYALKDAVRDCVNSGRPQEVYGVRFAMEDGWMTARLPSGRKLWYWKPGWVNRPDRNLTPAEYRKYAAGYNVSLTDKDIEEDVGLKRDYGYFASKQGRTSFLALWYGLITENIVQALARDLLVYSMFKLNDNGYPVILTIHDEILSEVAEALVNEKEFRQIMEERPPWAVDMGIPVSAEPWSGDCYRKA
jgi:DNA polymerase